MQRRRRSRGRPSRRRRCHTGLAGNFDFDLTWAPDELAAPAAFAADQPARSNSPSAAPTGPSLVTALQEQLGLKLTAATVPTDALVIDSISRPMAD